MSDGNEANGHWRKESEGQPKYLYLLYPQKQGEQRRRDDIGYDRERIENAGRGHRARRGV